MQQSQENNTNEAKNNLENNTETSNENLENNSEIDLEQDTPEPLYDAENSELEEMLKDAATTKADIADQERKEKQAEKMAEEQQSLEMTPEQAAELAVKGIVGTIQFAREQTGVDMKITQPQLQIGAALFTPVIMKYGPIVQKYISNAVSGADEDSNMPEYLAAGGTVGLGALMYWQYHKAKKAQSQNNGD